jgi:hypothetical protein
MEMKGMTFRPAPIIIIPGNIRLFAPFMLTETKIYRPADNF